MADEHTKAIVKKFLSQQDDEVVIEGEWVGNEPEATMVPGFESDEAWEAYKASYGYGGTTHTSAKKEKDPPEQPLDTTGEPLTEEDIMTMLASITDSRMRIDKDASKGVGGTPQQQAERARTLSKHYDDLEKKLIAQRRQLREWREYQLDQAGARDYKMPTDEGNVELTSIVDEQVDQFHRKVRLLKEETAANIRAKLDDTDDVTVEARDRIYEDLVNNQVIEDWEPLEF